MACLIGKSPNERPSRIEIGRFVLIRFNVFSAISFERRYEEISLAIKIENDAYNNNEENIERKGTQRKIIYLYIYIFFNVPVVAVVIVAIY